MPVASALLSFISCAVLGGLLVRFFGSLSVLLPTLLTATLTFRAWREDCRQFALQSPAANGMSPAPLPRFDVWPDSLVPRATAEQPEAAPTIKDKPEPRTPREVERPPMKRTVSGTRIKTTTIKDE